MFAPMAISGLKLKIGNAIIARFSVPVMDHLIRTRNNSVMPPIDHVVFI